MDSKRIKKNAGMSLEEKYERWKAFTDGCHENRTRIAALLRKHGSKKGKLAEFDLASMLPSRNISA